MKKKLLLIDDEPDFIAMIQMRLEANDGMSGLATADQERPNLILLDVMMPGMDGFETLRKLRRQEGTKQTPVIMLTARGESRAIFKAQGLGVTDYLIKPCDSKELLDLVGKYA